MALNIIKSSDSMDVKYVKVLIYGEPGTGKTSLGFTCANTLCLDFDKGSHRSHRVGDVLEIGSFSDALDLINTSEGRDILSGYQTVMIDTAGTLLNYMTLYIKDNEQSVFGASRVGAYYDRRKNGLTLQGYGVLKQCFKNFTDALTSLRKDLIFISHETVEKNGDDLKKIPSVSGGSYDILMSQMDFIGYMYIYGSDRVVDFTPSHSHYGKDSGNLGRLVIPPIPPNIDFFGYNISKGKSVMGKVSREVAALAVLTDDYRKMINDCDSCEGINDLLDKVRSEKIASVQNVAKTLLMRRAGDLGFKFDKETNLFA